MIRSLWSRVRTFRRPSEPDLSDVPEVGSEAPGRPRVGAGRPRVVLFLRHVGCAFGESMLEDLREASENHPEIEFVAVTHGDSDAATNWCEELGIGTVEVEQVAGGGDSVEWCTDTADSDIRVFVDPDREIYAEWGLGLGGADHLLDPRVVVNLLKVHLGGARDRESSGTRWQRSGLFAVDADGNVRAVHVADYAGDMPDVEVATTFLAGESEHGTAEETFSEFESDWVVGESQADTEPEPSEHLVVSQVSGTGQGGGTTEREEPTSAITPIEASEWESALDRRATLPADREDLTPAVTRVETTETAEADADTDTERVRLRADGGD